MTHKALEASTDISELAARSSQLSLISQRLAIITLQLEVRAEKSPSFASPRYEIPVSVGQQ